MIHSTCMWSKFLDIPLAGVLRGKGERGGARGCGNSEKAKLFLCSQGK